MLQDDTVITIVRVRCSHVDGSIIETRQVIVCPFSVATVLTARWLGEYIGNETDYQAARWEVKAN